MDSSALKKKSSAGTVLAILVVLALVAVIAVIESQKRDVEAQLQQFSTNANGNQAQNAAQAKAVIEKVRRIYALPTTGEPTVATIVKVEELRKLNHFYDKAQNGDNLLVTNDRAVLYRPSTNVIVDVVPIQIQPSAASSSAQGQVPASAASAGVSSASLSASAASQSSH